MRAPLRPHSSKRSLSGPPATRGDAAGEVDAGRGLPPSGASRGGLRGLPYAGADSHRRTRRADADDCDVPPLPRRPLQHAGSGAGQRPCGERLLPVPQLSRAGDSGADGERPGAGEAGAEVNGDAAGRLCPLICDPTQAKALEWATRHFLNREMIIAALRNNPEGWLP